MWFKVIWFTSLVWHVVALSSLRTTQPGDQVRIKLISQIWLNYCKKVLKYCNGTAISALLSQTLLAMTVNFDLNLNIVNLLLDYLVHLCNIAINFLMFLKIYHNTLTSCIWYQYTKIFCIAYLWIAYLTYAKSKWSTIVK